jgi:hypothetical protein
MIVDEELFQLAAELLAQITYLLYVGKAVGVFFHGDNPVVAFFLLTIALLALDDTDGLNAWYTTRAV